MGHRGRWPDQDLRLDEGSRRGRPAGRTGQRLLAARPERSRQDHDGPDPVHPAAARRRAGAGGRVRHHPRPASGPPQHQPDRSVRGAGRTADRGGEPAHDGPAVRAARRGRRAPRGRAAREVRPDRGRPPPGGDLLRRHAPPARPGRQPGRPPRGDLPRRADDRPGPAQPPGDVAGHRGPGRLRGDRLPDHPVPGGGGPAGRAGRGPGRRPHRGRRDHRGAQGPCRRAAPGPDAGRAGSVRRGRAPAG